MDCTVLGWRTTNHQRLEDPVTLYRMRDYVLSSPSRSIAAGMFQFLGTQGLQDFQIHYGKVVYMIGILRDFVYGHTACTCIYAGRQPWNNM